MKLPRGNNQSAIIKVAPPRGERGLKLPLVTDALKRADGRSPSWGAWIETLNNVNNLNYAVVAPPRGERGLKPILYPVCTPKSRRSPSWGAWIETAITSAATAAHICRSPSWGAWIEIKTKVERAENARVAPPRGERGLKYSGHCNASIDYRVAPPRGERGLKFNLCILY